MKQRVNEFLDLVQECQTKLPELAKQLNADSFKTTWSIEDEYGDNKPQFSCSIGIQMPHHWMGSYVSLDHPFEKAEASIRRSHSEWAINNQKRQAERQEQEIKDRLYQEFLNQKATK